MKKLFFVLGFFAIIFPLNLEARPSGSKVSMPSFEDNGDRFEVIKASVTSVSATLFWSPTPEEIANTRKLQIINPSTYTLHLASYNVGAVNRPESYTYPIHISSANTNYPLDLDLGTTIYLRYEEPASSVTVRALRRYQSGK